MRMGTATFGWTRLVLGAVFTFFTCMTVVGFQAILPAMKDDGVFAYLCPGGVSGCHSQSMHLDLMFIVATSFVNLTSVAVGFIIAKTGPRVSCMIGGAIVALGSVIFAVSSESFPAWIAGYGLMGAGGPFIAFAMFTLPNGIPAESQGLGFSMIIGALDGSAAMMWFMGLIHRYHGAHIKGLFLGFAILPALMFLVAIWIFRPAKGAADAGGEAAEGAGAGADTDGASEQGDETWLQQEHLSNGQVVVTRPFFLCCVWASWFITSKYFYMQNLNQQLQWITNNEDQTNTAVQVFSALLPAAGSAIPITGAIMDKGGAVVALIVLSILQGIVGIFSIIPSYGAQYVTMLVLVFNRFLFFAAAPFVLSKLYGARGINSIYGMALFVGACMNFTNYLWTYISTVTLSGNWLPLNLILHLGTCSYGLFFAWSVRGWRQDFEAGKGGGLRAKLMPTTWK
jgi:hypothetical protein